MIARLLTKMNAEAQDQRNGEGQLGKEDDRVEDKTVKVGNIEFCHQLTVESEGGAISHLLEPVFQTTGDGSGSFQSMP